ncbi:DciA family protein [Dechloromonas sp. CZR5]|uniref:DciA family protein n=1 Tax=Dechloromonas sp. CZR5 TaxID=2608630 RepID=UPI00168B11F0|nr:DciA family protein [Dechloromonas sp. CZR5]
MYKGPEQYLNSDATTSRIMAHARLLQKLSRRFEAVAPAGLRHAARVANYKSGTIVIHTDNGAVAAKIRQMSQRLCNELSKGGAECSALEVKVQPRQIPYQSTSSTLKPLSGKAFGLLESTADNLPEGPLRKALKTLLERAARAE